MDHGRTSAADNQLLAYVEEFEIEQLLECIRFVDPEWRRDLDWRQNMTGLLGDLIRSSRIHDRRLRLLARLRQQFEGAAADIDHIAGLVDEEERGWRGGGSWPCSPQWLVDIESGPLVPWLAIPVPVLTAFVRQAPLVGQEVSVIGRARTIFFARHPGCKFLDLSLTPPRFAYAAPAYWRTVLADAGRYGPPVLAALLLAIPDPVSTYADERQVALELLESLRDKTYRQMIEPVEPVR